MNADALLRIEDLKISLGDTSDESSVPTLQIFRLIIWPFVLRFKIAKTSQSYNLSSSATALSTSDGDLTGVSAYREGSFTSLTFTTSILFR